jgi:hypothetical protein
MKPQRWTIARQPIPFRVVDDLGREVPGVPPQNMADAMDRLAFWNQHGKHGPYTLASALPVWNPRAA